MSEGGQGTDYREGERPALNWFNFCRFMCILRKLIKERQEQEPCIAFRYHTNSIRLVSIPHFSKRQRAGGHCAACFCHIFAVCVCVCRGVWMGMREHVYRMLSALIGLKPRFHPVGKMVVSHSKWSRVATQHWRRRNMSGHQRPVSEPLKNAFGNGCRCEVLRTHFPLQIDWLIKLMSMANELWNASGIVSNALARHTRTTNYIDPARDRIWSTFYSFGWCSAIRMQRNHLQIQQNM